MTVRTKKAARRRRRTVTERETTVKSILLALPVTVATGLLLLFITTALLLCTGDPDRYHTVAGYVLIYATAFIGAFAAVRINRRRAPLLCGLGAGASLLLLITVVGLCLPAAWRNTTPVALSLLTHALLLPAALLGAFAAARKAERRRRHRH